MPPKLDNVQKLLAAEEKRNAVIAEAKLRKQQKVKQAKVDAENEVGAFRREKEIEYEEYRAQQGAAATAEHSLVENGTNEELIALRALTSQRMEKVANLMQQHILAVNESS